MTKKASQCQKQTATNLGSAIDKASSRDLIHACRRKVARVAGRRRLSCTKKDWRRAAKIRGSEKQSRSTFCRTILRRFLSMLLTCRLYCCSKTMGHPALEGKWCHYSADECHNHAPYKEGEKTSKTKNQKSDTQPGQQPEGCRDSISQCSFIYHQAALPKET